MSNTNNSVEIQNAIEVYKNKQNFKTSFFLAAIGAVAGFYYFSDPYRRAFIGAIFKIGFDTVPLAAAATGAFAGFFLIELFALSIFAIVGIAAFIWLQSAYIPGSSFDVTISNQSLKNLSFLVVKPTKCGSWKPKNEVDIVISVLPGETKKVFNGCKASSVEWTQNGLSQRTFECLELVSNVELIYSQQGWTDQSLKNGFDPKIGAIRKCKS